MWLGEIHPGKGTTSTRQDPGQDRRRSQEEGPAAELLQREPERTQLTESSPERRGLRQADFDQQRFGERDRFHGRTDPIAVIMEDTHSLIQNALVGTVLIDE